MVSYKIFAAVTALSLIALPAMAQGDKEQNGHHYNGGPKTEVPHHMGKKETTGAANGASSGGHHYRGGPATSIPHHMGDIKDR